MILFEFSSGFKPLTNLLVLGNLPKLSVPPFSHPYNGTDNTDALVITEETPSMSLGWCLICKKHSISVSYDNASL